MRKTHPITIFLVIFTLVCLNMASGAAASRFLPNGPLTVAALEDPAPTAAVSGSTLAGDSETAAVSLDPVETAPAPEPTSAGHTPRSKTVSTQTSRPQDASIQTDGLSVSSSPTPSVKPNRETKPVPAVRFKPTARTIWHWVSTWWNRTSFHLQLWYILCALGLFFYILRWNRLRQPFLFLSLILLGFYFGGPPDPINAVSVLFTPAASEWWTALILLLIPVVISLLWGRVFCGWICPLGAVQEFLYIDSPKRRFLTRLNRPLKYLKYLMLIALGYLIWQTGHNFWADYEPSRSLFTFQGSVVALAILGGFLLISVFISRPFCRYLCPLGAILALTSRIAPLKMRADADRCMVCNKCIQICPMDAISAFNPEIDLPDISSAECITCGRCQKVCSKSALRVTGIRIDRVYYSKSSHSEKIH